MNLKKYLYPNLVIMLMLCVWLLAEQGSAGSKKLEQDQHKAEKIVKKLNALEVLGPLAPVALSPFFGLTCLSGTSILCNKGVLPENAFLMGSDALNNGFVFAVFLLLTIVTSAPKLISATKIFAQITDQLETYAGIISYAVILMLAQTGQGAEQEATVYTAGIFTFTQQGLFVCVAAVNIFVISSVRFFFELLVLISPIPALDAMFECANKAVVGLLIAIYAFNPWLAFVLNVILFLLCLLIFRWVNRRIRYLRTLLLDPFVLALKRKWSQNPGLDPDRQARKRLAQHLPEADLLVKCFPSRKVGRIKTKDLCYLLRDTDQFWLLKPRLFRLPIAEELDRQHVAGEIEEGLLSYTITFAGDGKRKACKFIFGSAYKQTLDEIKLKLTTNKVN